MSKFDQLLLNNQFESQLDVITMEGSKHFQRNKGPEGLVQLTKVTCLGHPTSSNTNLDQISSSESRPSINFKISTKLKLQNLDQTKLQNLGQDYKQSGNQKSAAKY